MQDYIVANNTFCNLKLQCSPTKFIKINATLLIIMNIGEELFIIHNYTLKIRKSKV